MEERHTQASSASMRQDYPVPMLLCVAMMGAHFCPCLEAPKDGRKRVFIFTPIIITGISYEASLY